MSETRILPLPEVTGIWKYESSTYPDVIKVPMSDGKVVKYTIDVDLPHPSFEKAMENVRKMKVGYQYKGKHEKK